MQLFTKYSGKIPFVDPYPPFDLADTADLGVIDLHDPQPAHEGERKKKEEKQRFEKKKST